MANTIVPLDAEVLSRVIATHITRSAKTPPVTADLSASISEVTLQTQTLGASLLQVTIIDPNWTLARSGFLGVDTDGLLDKIDINFPEGSELWWRLAMVDLSNEVSQPNLTLTFQDRIISYLQDRWGPKAASSGTTTRAQFVKQLVDEVGHDGIEGKPIRFVCKAINVIQPVASTTAAAAGTAGTMTVTSAATTAHVSARANKTGGIGQGAAVTIKGQSPPPSQMALINQVMGLAIGLNAPNLAIQALLEACIQENSFTNNPGGGGTSNGLLQLTASTAASFGISALDVNACVTAFLTKGFYGHGGAIGNANANPTKPAWQVAQETQGSAYPMAYNAWLGEANAIIAAYGGGTPGSVGTSATGSSTTSDVKQLTRGSPSDPDEDSWTCMQRLAAEVNWSLFSNSDTIYYDPGTTIIAQKPSLYLSLDPGGTTWTATNPLDGDSARDVVATVSGLWDNTAFRYLSTKKQHGRTARQTRIRKPQTPTQIRMSMICGPLDYRAGDVFVFQNSGPFNGRWIVVDTTRNCLADVHTQFTLAPGVAPNPEPAGTPPPSSASSTITAPGGGATTIAATNAAGTFAFPLPTAVAGAQSSWSLDQGVDITAPGGSPLFAVASGTVVLHGISGFGPDAPVLQLDSPISGYTHVYYGHAGPNGAVAIGTHVTIGQQISSVGYGIVGISTGPHLEIGFCNGSGNPVGPQSAPDMRTLLASAVTHKVANPLSPTTQAVQGVINAANSALSIPNLFGP